MKSFHTKVFLKGHESNIGPHGVKWAQPEQTLEVSQLLLSIPHATQTHLTSPPGIAHSQPLLTDSHETGAHTTTGYSHLQDTDTAMNIVTESSGSQQTRGFPDTAISTAALTTVSSQTPSRTTSPDTYQSPSQVPPLSSHLLSSDTATKPLSSETTSASVATPPPTDFVPAHDNRTVVLACVLGGVLGLVGCAIIAFCVFNFSGWYNNYKMRRAEHNLSPSVAPLEKMDSNDPLAHLDDSVEIRRGSAVYISSPLTGDNILRLKGLPPIIPHKNPMRQPQHNAPAEPGFYDFQPRPDIRPPRPAPPPPPRRVPPRGASLNYHEGPQSRIVHHSSSQQRQVGETMPDQSLGQAQGQHQGQEYQGQDPAQDQLLMNQGHYQSRNQGHEPEHNEGHDEEQDEEQKREENEEQKLEFSLESKIIDLITAQSIDSEQHHTSVLVDEHAKQNRSTSVAIANLQQDNCTESMNQTPGTLPGSLLNVPELEENSRLSATSSFYSNSEVRTPATPLADLRLSIARTSRASFANVMGPVTTRLPEPFLEPIRDDSVGEHEEELAARNEAEAEAEAEALNTTNHSSHRPHLGSPIPPSPEVYDDGYGEYPTVILNEPEEAYFTYEENSFHHESADQRFDDLDFFA